MFNRETVDRAEKVIDTLRLNPQKQVQDLCDEIGISRSVYYKYLKNKDSCMETGNQKQEFVSEVDALRGKGYTLADAIEKLAKTSGDKNYTTYQYYRDKKKTGEKKPKKEKKTKAVKILTPLKKNLPVLIPRVEYSRQDKLPAGQCMMVIGSPEMLVEFAKNMSKNNR
jgi:hypothetical protein